MSPEFGSIAWVALIFIAVSGLVLAFHGLPGADHANGEGPTKETVTNDDLAEFGVRVADIEAAQKEPLSVAWLRTLISAANGGDCRACLALLSAELRSGHAMRCDQPRGIRALLDSLRLAWIVDGATFHGERQEGERIVLSVVDSRGVARSLELMREKGFVRLKSAPHAD